MRNALVTFVRAPEKGKVKTRLQKGLGADRTLRVYKQFISDVVTTCSQVKGVTKFMACAPSDRDAFLRRMADQYDLSTFSQHGESLGDKIVNGFIHCLERGFTRVVIIGSDSPTIPADYIRKAFHLLKRHEFVVGPCCDGGMYLVGTRDRVLPRIFSNIPWDTPEVLNMVLEKLFKYKIDFAMLPFWYDVDDITDYQFLKLHHKYLKRLQ
jgi:hypothetical protein